MMSEFDVSAFVTGWLIAISAIMAIGAQNMFLIRQSIIRQHHLWVCTICIGCDTVLMSVGVFGLGKLFNWLPSITFYFSWLAVIFLVLYAIHLLYSVRHIKHVNLQYSPSKPVLSSTRMRVILFTLGVTLLNPHVYIDTVFIIGSAAENLAANHQLSFWFGSVLASWVWFGFLTFCSCQLSEFFQKPLVWRWLNMAMAGVMLFIAAQIALSRLQ